MARKKSPSKKKASRKSAVARRATTTALSTEMVDLLAQYTQHDVESALVEGGGFPSLSTKGGKFMLGESLLPSSIDVVVLGAMKLNQYYPDKWQPDVMFNSTCFALNLDNNEKTMGPPDDLATRVADQCSDCELNDFGSGEGKGKACRNTVRLVLLAADNIGPDTDWSKAHGMRLSVPPTSLKFWGSHAKSVTQGHNRPLFSVVTRLSIERTDTAHELYFERVGDIEQDEQLLDLIERFNGEGKMNLQQLPIQDEPDTSQSRPSRISAKGGRKRAASKKKASKKKASRRRAGGGR